MLFALLFNSVASVLVAGSLIRHAQAYADDNVMLICTGSTFKWISVSTYNQSGKLEFVEPPADSPSEYASPKCSFTYLSQTKHYIDWDISAFFFPIPPTSESVIHEYLSVLFQPFYLLALSRAPPTLV